MASRAALALVRAARANDAAAQFALGRLYIAGGEGLRRNLAAAAHWLVRAAENGCAEAGALLAEHIPGDMVEEPQRARRWYDAAATAGSQHAAMVLSAWLLAGKLGVPEPEPAKALLEEAAGAGLPEAQRTLAQVLLDEGRPEHRPRARALLAAAARQGDRGAQESLADLLWESEYLDCWQPGEVPGQPAAFMPQAAAAAEALWCHEQLAQLAEQAAKTEFRYRLGVLLLRARRQEAVTWIEGAAEAGHARAQYLLGLLHIGPKYVGCLAAGEEGGPGRQWLPRNYKKAARWLGRAAENELAEASLALHLLHGQRGFSHRDPALQRRYLRQAAHQGHPEAQFRLGRLLERRRQDGDDLAAVRWLHWAASQGHQEADALYRKLVHSAPAAAPLWTERRAAIERIARSHPLLSERLALADVFGLRRHELLLIEPATAGSDGLLVVDVRRAQTRTRRLIAIETAAQRAALARAASRIPAGEPVAGDVHGPYRRRWEQFRGLCARLEIDWKLFD